MSNKPNTKRAVEAYMSKETLGHRIAQAKLHLNTVLLEGGDTMQARAALKKLMDEQAEADAAVAAQQAAQQSLKQIEADGINRAAQELLAARNVRIAAITTRYPIPDMRSSSHA
ncbi:hypothetical protein PQR46_18615 [Paraburkholderia sediminicola]|uniref:hypothetical protein n=1 Tax=Paraburkholderia sediminicola TaxID=458836 RepID=UPI0038BC9CFA